MIPFPNIHPEIFSVQLMGVEFALRWYSLAYVLGFMCAYLLMRFYVSREYLWKHHFAPLDVDQTDDLLFYLIVGVIFGGRIGYVIFYNIEYFVSDPLKIFWLWEGGMSFHGGFLGVVCAAVLYCRINGLQLLAIADLLALASPPGLLFGRISNFINAELWGSPTSVPWGVIFPGERAQECASVSSLCARHPTQLYEAGLEGLLLMLIVTFLAFRGGLRHVGLTAGIFVLGYACARFFVEYYRVPDPQFFSADNPNGHALNFAEIGFTMGQLLCLPMICLGVVLIVYAVSKRF